MQRSTALKVLVKSWLNKQFNKLALRIWHWKIENAADRYLLDYSDAHRALLAEAIFHYNCESLKLMLSYSNKHLLRANDHPRMQYVFRYINSFMRNIEENGLAQTNVILDSIGSRSKNRRFEVNPPADIRNVPSSIKDRVSLLNWLITTENLLDPSDVQRFCKDPVATMTDPDNWVVDLAMTGKLLRKL